MQRAESARGEAAHDVTEERLPSRSSPSYRSLLRGSRSTKRVVALASLIRFRGSLAPLFRSLGQEPDAPGSARSPLAPRALADGAATEALVGEHLLGAIG